MKRRKIIVQIAASADGYIARSDGDITWLSERPHPKDMYGMNKFVRSIDTILFGRKTYEIGVQMGATFDAHVRHYVFSRQPPPSSVPKGIEFVNESIPAFAKRLRERKGKDIWMMGGADLIGCFLDAGEIDEFMISMIPTFIGEGIPLIAPRHRQVPLSLLAVRPFSDGVVQVHYSVHNNASSSTRATQVCPCQTLSTRLACLTGAHANEVSPRRRAHQVVPVCVRQQLVVRLQGRVA